MTKNLSKPAKNRPKLAKNINLLILVNFGESLMILKFYKFLGWDEALLTMQAGEVAAVTIEPEWAYGKKGQPEAGIGPNQTLYFEITLDRIGA